jgi:hypothetical protein
MGMYGCNVLFCHLYACDSEIWTKETRVYAGKRVILQQKNKTISNV